MKKPKLDKRLVEQVIPYQIRKGDLRKLEIIQAAIELIATQGIGALTFESVGKQSKISKSHVAYHFPELNELVKAAIKYVYATGQGIVVDFLKSATSPEAQLRGYIEGTFQWMQTHSQHSSMALLLAYLSMTNKEYRRLQTELRDIGVRRITAIVEVWRKSRQAKPRDIIELSENIHALIMGKLLYFNAAETGKDVRLAIDETVRGALMLINY